MIIIGPTSRFFKGGIVHFTYSLIEALKKKQQITLISFARGYPAFLFPGKKNIEPNQKEKGQAQELPILDWLNPLSFIKTFWLIKTSLAEKVVFQWWTWFWTLPYLIILLLLKLFSNKKIIFIVHNVYDHEASFVKKLSAKLILGFADSYIVHSEEDKNKLLTWFPKRKNFIYKKLHPFVKSFKYPVKIKINKKYFTLLFFGYVREYKGLDILLFAINKVAASIKNIRLIVAGEFWEKKAYYEKIIAKLGLNSKVQLIDSYIKNEDVGKFFAMADAVVLPYREATGTGVSRIALSFNKPIIATSSGDFLDLFKLGNIGVLVKPGDVNSLRDGIIKFYKSDRKEFINNIKLVKKHLNLNNYSEFLLNL